MRVSVVSWIFFQSKRNKYMASTTRRISTITVREMKEILKSKYDVDVSLGSVMNLRPFYVGNGVLFMQVLPKHTITI